MSKKRLGGRRHYWLNHGKFGVVFPFFLPNHAKAQTCDFDPKNKWRSYFHLLQLALSMGATRSWSFGISGAEKYHKWGLPSSQARQAW